MIIEDKILLFLDKFQFLSHKKRLAIYELLCNEDFFEKFSNSYYLIEKIISYSQFSSMCKDLRDENIDDYIKSIYDKGIKIITINSKDYPFSLKNIDNPPLVLYAKGDISLLHETNSNFAIVGTRHPTNYGKEVTEKFAKELTENGFNIVSGLADGVDTISQRSCLNAGGKTIGVLAGGLDYIYPPSNKSLSEQIIKNGLIVTEKPSFYRAVSYDFPYRNRIIAGLSCAVLITEASLKSGTMYTKEYALEYGKELFVVPGNITSSSSEGCNTLLKDLRIAMVTNTNDILENFNRTAKPIKAPTIQLSIDEAIVYDILKSGEKTFDEILLNTNFETANLSTLLTKMSLRGIIKKTAGNNYRI